MRKIIYIDLDNTLADHIGEANRLNISLKDAKHIKGFFKQLKPMPDAIESYIKESGHKVTGSVSKKTNYLLASPGEENTTKYKKAMELNINIIHTIDELEEIIDFN